MALSEHDNIAIAQIALFVPFLIIGIILCLRHGFGKAAGWLLLVIFSVVRILGSSLQLATIANPNNLSLYFGSLTLQSSGVSPLCAMLLAMINRSLMSVQKARNAVINPQVLRIAEIVVFVGLILSSIGGSNSGSEYAKTGVYEIASLTRVGLGLTIAGFALLVVTTIAVGLHISQAEPGEKRLVLAIALSLPFLLVRIIYAAIGIFGRNPDFGVVTGDVNILLGMAVVEEIIIMFIVESIGLTLRVAPKDATESKSRGGLISMVISTFKSRFHGYEMTSMDGHSGRSRV